MSGFVNLADSSCIRSDLPDLRFVVELEITQ